MRLYFIMGILVILAFLQLLTGCLADQSTSGTSTGTTVVNEPGPVPDPLTAPERTICDPFQTNSPSARDRGVVANLVWLDDTMPPRNGQPSLQHVDDYFSIGNIVDSTLYFNRIFVPTRRFDLGFSTQTGQQVLNHLGQPMYEYFALNMQSQLQLASNESPGEYQVAILSDDGAVLKMNPGTASEYNLVNNDGDHPTRMACSVQTITMRAGEKLPFVLNYYQGPRFHISLIMMWRPVPNGSDPDIPVNDLSCGTSGNDRFFDFNTDPSTPKTPYLELLARGWKVLENDNFSFPEQASNPCVAAEDTLTVSAFEIIGNVKVSPTSATMTVRWNSNIAANSQIEFRNVNTGTILRTSVDPAMVTAHQMQVTGLSPNTLYALKAISVSAGGQTAISDERALRTPR